ncbi:MAG: hypothetical protein Q4A58_06700 [Fusobacterium sp.]|uniref:hypothetical protein n=1 Tax=Fusobacterium sp. TaxID=68766 RepID=UPI0026DBDB37|nr:hypothetical protein [Fusobacterium sp.]MDO4690964.1 hypothetical protein [Fusobacterium sp.]
METTEKKALVEAYVAKLDKGISRELSVKKEIENDKVAVQYLEEKKATGVAFDNPVYDDYDSWIETIKKQIKKSENTLANIAFKKVEVEALKVFLTQG